MSWVRGIRNLYDLNANPDASESQVIGWLSTDTGPCPVISLDKYLNKSTEFNNQSKKILLFRIPHGLFGILVDSVENIFQVAVNRVFSIPRIVGGFALHCFDEAIYYESHLILALSPLSIYSKVYLNRLTSLNHKNLTTSDYSLLNISIANHRQRKIVIFTTATDDSVLYGLSITQIPQILQSLPVLHVPSSEEYLIGIIEWRGLILPVIDISYCVEKKRSKVESDGRILVVRLVKTPLYIAIMIQSQVTIQSFPIKQDLYKFDNLPNILSIHKSFKFQDQLLVVPDIDNIVMCDQKDASTCE
jgi:purine-binding chemotaxis protein CheW